MLPGGNRDSRRQDEYRRATAVFKTNAKPVSAYPDEVTWYDDVDIFDSYIISLSEAKNILENQENNILEEDDGVFYHDNFDDFTQYNKDKRQQKEINASYEDLGWEKIG